MAKKYKIIVPKPCAIDEDGLHVELMQADSIVDANNDVMKANMETFVQNGWAMEVKVDAPEETADLEAEAKPKRARNKKGQLKGDDPLTPDYNEAWEGGKAPKKTTKKKTTAKKTTKKKSS